MSGYFVYVIFLCTTLLSASPLPERVGEGTVSFARFGECEVYFYMNEEKAADIDKLKSHINNDLIMTVGQASLPCPTREVILKAIIAPDQDHEGALLLSQYALNTKKNIEQYLKISFEGVTSYVNLNLNWEALKLHHDRFTYQYQFLQDQRLCPNDYAIVQDLTLSDWEMGKGTFMGTLIQDGKFGDRYILCVFPGETIGTFYAEPAYHFSLPVQNIYPGQNTIPFHSSVAPLDFQDTLSCGSSKGKRMSAILRGVALKEQILKLRHRSKELPINKRDHKIFLNGPGAEYPNGITIQPLTDRELPITITNSVLEVETPGVIMLKLSVLENAFTIERVLKTFEVPIEHSDIEVYRLIKKGEGFSSINLLEEKIRQNSRVFILNSSVLPCNYRHFNLADLAIKRGMPWIQLYELNVGYVMEVPFDQFEHLYLTPCEELFFRNEIIDSQNNEYSELQSRIETSINIIIVHGFELDAKEKSMKK